ncbi:hypothetical protein D3C80_1908380 [compost metagenome]
MPGHLGRAAGKHRGKLFTANAPEQVRAAQGGASAFGELLQDEIAQLMAVAVVDALEVINIQQQERQG